LNYQPNKAGINGLKGFKSKGKDRMEIWDKKQMWSEIPVMGKFHCQGIEGTFDLKTEN